MTLFRWLSPHQTWRNHAMKIKYTSVQCRISYFNNKEQHCAFNVLILSVLVLDKGAGLLQKIIRFKKETNSKTSHSSEKSPSPGRRVGLSWQQWTPGAFTAKWGQSALSVIECAVMMALLWPPLCPGAHRVNSPPTGSSHTSQMFTSHSAPTVWKKKNKKINSSVILEKKSNILQ